MNDVMRPDAVTVRREPKTQRGRATRDDILSTARNLLCEKWLDEIPFTELAASAGKARASLLHVFPNWPTVLWCLFEREVGQLDESYAAAIALKRARPSVRAYAMLAPLLDRAERTGRLYPNIRCAMFTWHRQAADEDLIGKPLDFPLRRDMLGSLLRGVLYRRFIRVEELLGIPRDESLKRDEVRAVPIGECLVNFAFDLAAGGPTYFETFDERRLTLRSVIDVVGGGIRTSKPRVAKKRRG